MTFEPIQTTNKKQLYLTFDDGPLEPYTTQILEVLSKYGAKATFFVCGKNIERDPKSLQNIFHKGHSIGIHSYSHSPWKTIFGSLYLEVEATRKLILKYTGVSTPLYRSPWGVTMPWLSYRLRRNGYKIFHWNIMAFDWWQPGAKFMVDHIVGRAYPGATILLHDGDQIKIGNRENTVKALDVILSKLTERGFEFNSLLDKYNDNGQHTVNFLLDLAAGLRYLCNL